MEINRELIEEALAGIRAEMLVSPDPQQVARIARHAATILMVSLKARGVPERDIVFLTDQIEFDVEWGGKLNLAGQSPRAQEA